MEEEAFRVCQTPWLRPFGRQVRMLVVHLMDCLVFISNFSYDLYVPGSRVDSNLIICLFLLLQRISDGKMPFL
jgi:hypothetical protein